MFWGRNRWSQPEKVGLERHQKTGNKGERERQEQLECHTAARPSVTYLFGGLWVLLHHLPAWETVLLCPHLTFLVEWSGREVSDPRLQPWPRTAGQTPGSSSAGPFLGNARTVNVHGTNESSNEEMNE